MHSAHLSGFSNLHGVTVLWHGWLKKLGRFSKRWRRRYFVFLSTKNGARELRHYDAVKDVNTLLMSTPKGVITLTDATGICCFLPSMTGTTAPPKKMTMFNRSDTHDNGADVQDQKFAVLTPLHVNLLAFDNGKEWDAASESQQGLSLLAALSAFFPTLEVLHSGWMMKKSERTTPSATSIMSYWKRRYFVFLNSGDLLYFRDDTLCDLYGRVDVRHAPTVRVTGETFMEEKKKESVFKFSKLAASEEDGCLVWIATPPSKMFILKLEDDHECASGTGRRHNELTPSAKKWLSLLLKGHAKTKYTQLEKCIADGKYDQTPEIISAIRAGIPDELRGQLWRGFSGAADLQRRAELKRAIRKVANENAYQRSSAMEKLRIKTSGSTAPKSTPSLYSECAGPIDSIHLDTPETRMILSRLAALVLRESQVSVLRQPGFDSDGQLQHRSSETSSPSEHESDDRALDLKNDNIDDDVTAEVTDQGKANKTEAWPYRGRISARNTLKKLVKGKLCEYVYPSEAAATYGESAARRRLLLASSRYNPYSHPCPWKVSCLLLAYLDEESAFWITNSIMDFFLPGYFHGYRPALQIDVSAFNSLLKDRAPALYSHMKSLKFPLDRLTEGWFLSLFTASSIPLPTVLRIWDAFFAQGLRIFYGIGMALLLRAEETLFRAKSVAEAEEFVRATERSSIDANALFSDAFKVDLNISWLPDDQFDKVRMSHRTIVMENVSQKVDHFNQKLGLLDQMHDLYSRCASVAHRLQSSTKSDSKPKSPTVPNNDLLDEDMNEEQDTLQASLHIFLESVQTATATLTKLSSELRKRQSKWIAISSQLTACPVGKLPNLDLQSWLAQVRDGKISGGGQDSFTATLDTTSDDIIFSAPGIINSSELFLGIGEYSQGSFESSTCLIHNRKDLQLSHPHLSEVLLYALVSSLKALCAVRVECLSATYRCMLRRGRWIDHPVEYPSAKQNGPSLRRTSKPSPVLSNSRRSKARTLDDSDLVRRKNTEDQQMSRMLNRSFYRPKNHPAEREPDHASSTRHPFQKRSTSWEMQTSDWSTSTDNDPTGFQSSSDLFEYSDIQHLDELVSLYKDGEHTFRTTHDMMMTHFSHFIRLESRVSSSDNLHDRAFILEEDLRRELQEIETEIHGSQWLHQL